MSGTAVGVDPIVIESGQTISVNTLGRALVRHIEGVEFYAPATLPETVTVQVTSDGGATWVAHQEAGADITLIAAKATIVRPIACNGIRLVAGGAVAAERSIGVVLYDG